MSSYTKDTSYHRVITVIDVQRLVVLGCTEKDNKDHSSMGDNT